MQSFAYDQFLYGHLFGAVTDAIWIGGAANGDREWSWADTSVPFIYSNWDVARPDNDDGEG